MLETGVEINWDLEVCVVATNKFYGTEQVDFVSWILFSLDIEARS